MKKLAVMLLVLFGVYGYAQNMRGSISGQVTDPMGAAVVDATVTVTNTDTGAVTKTVSRQEGLYNALDLMPGNYSVNVTAAGFKVFDRKGIVLQTQQNATVNVKLALGTTTEVITVTEAVPLIDTADASTGQVLTAQEVQDLPSDGSSPLGFARVEYGVVAKGKHALGGALPIDNSTVDDFSLGGGNSSSNELLLNGVPNMQDSARTAGFSPQLDAVDAVRVDEFGANVTYGDTSGGTVNITTKSGTNAYHMTIDERYQAAGCSGLTGTLTSRSANHCTWMSALPWLHTVGSAVPSATHFNQFGGTLGGPIAIPHVFNTRRNRLFFFYAYEGYIGAQPMTATTGTVPTDAERQGDFSNLLSFNSSNQLYNPYSIVAGGTQTNFKRNPIPNNCLTSTSSNCAGKGSAGLTLSPIALAYLKLVPEPNQNLTGDGENNYFTYTPTTEDYRSHQGRIDYDISANDKLFGEAHRSKTLSNASNYFHNTLSGKTSDTIMAGVTLEEVHTFSPTLVLDTRGSLTRYDTTTALGSAGISPTSLGFPGYLASNSISLAIPYIYFTDSTSPTGYSGEPAAVENFDTVMLFSTVTKLYHTHSFLAGFDVRQLKDSRQSAGYDNGYFNFARGNGGPMTAGTGAAYQAFGSSMALFMLGIPTSGGESIVPALQNNSWLSSFFFQDDWRPKPNMTVSYGVRVEHEIPVNESQNRMANGFNPAATNEVTTAAENAYLTNYTSAALLQPEAFSPTGGITYASSSARHPYQTAPLYFSPRIGVSWAPEYFKGKGVVRLGFGIYNSPFNNYYQGQSYGYSATSTYSASSTSYFKDIGSLSDPFPTATDAASSTNPMPSPANPIIQPTGNTLGVNAQLGSSVVFYPSHVKVPYSERLSLDLQYQVGKTVLVELGYIFNRQIHMSYSSDISQTPLLPYLSRSPYYDVYTTDKLSGSTYTGGPTTTSVTNPFKGLTGMTGTYLTSTLMAPSRYLVSFPQYTSDVTEQLIPGSIGKYNALNARVAKTMGHGLTLNGIFEWSRLLGTFNIMNQGEIPAYGETTSDYPFHFSGYGTYLVPVGRGRQFFANDNRILDEFVGGWQISAMYQFLSGTPDQWGNVIYTGTSWKDFHNKQHSSANYLNQTTFNTSVFDTRTVVNSALASQGDPGKANYNPPVQPSTYNYRTFPYYLLRSDYTSNWDGNVQKDITAWREAKLELRLDCFNLLNRPQYAAPTLTPTSSTFGMTRASGVLSGTSSRHFQLSAHITF